MFLTKSKRKHNLSKFQEGSESSFMSFSQMSSNLLTAIPVVVNPSWAETEVFEICLVIYSVCVCVCVCVRVCACVCMHSCPTLCSPMDCSPPHYILFLCQRNFPGKNTTLFVLIFSYLFDFLSSKFLR